jgi:hypothetical protein
MIVLLKILLQLLKADMIYNKEIDSMDLSP